jgi:NhaP-type Na+/H+ and K+/H+ antiporter
MLAGHVSLVIMARRLAKITTKITTKITGSFVFIGLIKGVDGVDVDSD